MMTQTPDPRDDVNPFTDWNDDDFDAQRVIPAKDLPTPGPLSSSAAYDALNAHDAPNGGMFVEVCSKCRGSGRYFGRSRHGVACFACKGAGKFMRKTSPEQRAKAKANAEAAKVRKEAKGWDGFAGAHPEAAAWIVERAPRFDFAAQMQVAVRKYGHLTVGQLAAVERLRVKDAERDAFRAQEAATREEREAAAPTMEMAKLEEAFARAKASGLKRIVLRVAGFKMTPAKANSANAGSIYVKAADGEYLGKITAGKFRRSFACDEVTAGEVLAAGADPLAAAVAYGRRTGSCACCGLELTNAESIERGIGPICASKWGL